MPKQTFFNLAAEKRMRIEKCAMDEFEEYIYDTASINRVVKNAGIAKGSFYQYFENKMDLAIHVMTIIATEEASYIEAYMPGDDAIEEDFFMWIKKQVKVSIQFGNENLQYIKVYRNLMMSNEGELQTKLAEVTSTMGVDFYRDKIKWHMEKGTLRDDIGPDFLGEYLMTIIVSLIDRFFRSSSTEETVDIKEISVLMDQVLDLAENGLKNRG